MSEDKDKIIKKQREEIFMLTWRLMNLESMVKHLSTFKTIGPTIDEMKKFLEE